MTPSAAIAAVSIEAFRRRHVAGWSRAGWYPASHPPSLGSVRDPEQRTASTRDHTATICRSPRSPGHAWRPAHRRDATGTRRRRRRGAARDPARWPRARSRHAYARRRRRPRARLPAHRGHRAAPIRGARRRVRRRRGRRRATRRRRRGRHRAVQPQPVRVEFVRRLRQGHDRGRRVAGAARAGLPRTPRRRGDGDRPAERATADVR